MTGEDRGVGAPSAPATSQRLADAGGGGLAHASFRLRMLFVIRSLVIGGAERQCAELARALAQRGHDVTVCTLGTGGPLEKLLLSDGLKRVTVGHEGRLTAIRTAIRLRRLCREIQPDVIYSFLSVSNILCAIALPRSFRERLVWGVRASWMDLAEYGLVARAAMRAEAALSSRPRLIIANSRAGVAHCVSWGFPAARMQCIENRIDVDRFCFSEAGRKRLRDLHGVSDEQRIVALVGRLDPIKGHRIFLRAAFSVAAQRGDLAFWCVGGGNSKLKGSLQALAAELGMSDRLTWLGDMADMPDVYSAADLVVSASLSEGFPNTVCEALVCGTPVIGTDVGDTARIVEGGGRCVAAGDASALAAAILEWFDHPSPDRGTTRQNFLRRFDPSLLLQQHEALLRSVVTSKHAS